MKELGEILPFEHKLEVVLMHIKKVRDIVLDILDGEYGGVAFPNGILAVYIRWGIWDRFVVWDINKKTCGVLSWNDRAEWITSSSETEFEIMKEGYEILRIHKIDFDMRLREWKFVIPHIIWWLAMEGELQEFRDKYWPANVIREADDRFKVYMYDFRPVEVGVMRKYVKIRDALGKGVGIIV